MIFASLGLSFRNAIFGLILLFLTLIALSQGSLAATNSIETIINDMKLPHEGMPHGVPRNYSWASHPRIGMGNDPGEFRALTAWGQLYEDTDGNPAKNTRVQIGYLEAYILGKSDAKWHQVQSSHGVSGSAFREDFARNVNRPSDTLEESDSTISVTVGEGYNFHFWPTLGRISIDPSNVAGVFITVQARLIIGDSKKPDDRNQARYLLSVGGDYWKTVDAPWDNWTTNGDIGIGRFKYVREDWRSFNMSTLSAQQIRLSPPPIN